jgi:predicted DNA-binding protein
MTHKRTRFTTSSKAELVEKLNELSEKTRLTKTRLVDEAIEDLLEKYKEKIKLYEK